MQADEKLTDNILELNCINKSFGVVQVLFNVSLKIKKGSIHALLGENGAGKSTLVKIINGAYEFESGSIILDGEKTNFKNIAAAKAAGIRVVHQELSYAPNLTVAENMFLGNELYGKIKPIMDLKEMNKKAKELLEQANVYIDPKTKMWDLSVSDIQMIEIIKVASSDAKLIIMDEPTSALSEREVLRLFDMIRALKKRGISIIYISHKLDEIKQIVDNITILRDGSVVETGPVSQYEIDDIVRLMIGRQMTEVFPNTNYTLQEKIYEVRNLKSEGVFKNVDFNVRKGEIVGLGGLMGSGRTEVARALFGLDPITSGEIYLEGEKIQIRSVKDAINKGIMMVSEDRKRFGIIPSRSIRENASIGILRKLQKLFILNLKNEREVVGKIFKQMHVKAPTIEAQIRTLSGGNQQKVVLAKWILANPKLLILDEPTRGIDVGAKVEIYNLISDMAKQGISIVLISSELSELIGMSNRIYLMRQGEIVSELEKKDFSQEKILITLNGGTEN